MDGQWNDFHLFMHFLRLKDVSAPSREEPISPKRMEMPQVDLKYFMEKLSSRIRWCEPPIL
jgi:hypothetical protein